MTLKQKVRKYNKDFESEIQSFRENPVDSDEEQAEPGEAFSFKICWLFEMVVPSVMLINVHYEA